MGQQMYVINQNPTPGSKAQDQYLQRLLKGVTSHGEVRSRRKRNVVQAIVAKGADRNDNERRFITGLSKAGLAAQADGTVIKSDNAVDEAEGGAAQRRQQPKRQTKSKRQAATAHPGGTKSSEHTAGSAAKTSLQKDKPAQGRARAGSSQEDAKPNTGGGKATGSARQPKLGQRKGPQRPKHPSSKK
jgi:YidC/Oxa1 family membrane protein insertase